LYSENFKIITYEIDRYSAVFVQFYITTLRHEPSLAARRPHVLPTSRNAAIQNCRCRPELTESEAGSGCTIMHLSKRGYAYVESSHNFKNK